MPVVEHSTVRMSQTVDYHSERTLVSKEQGAASLTVKEVELHPGWEGRMHTHPTDIAVMVTGGAIQMEIGDEIHTVRTGFTMVAPPDAIVDEQLIVLVEREGNIENPFAIARISNIRHDEVQ